MAERKPGLTGRRTKTGRVHVMVVLEPRHIAALTAEAFRRAAAIGSRKPDMSAVLREAIEAWIGKTSKR